MNLPQKFEERMRDMLGDEYAEFLEVWENSPIYQGIRINGLKKDAKAAVFKAVGELSKVLWCDNGYYIDKEKLSGKHPYHIGGLVYFQEPSAMSTVSALDIEKGDFVLDLCAAPGGKATQAAEKLMGEGVLVCNEIVSKRAAILAENIQRMGIKNAVVTNESPKRLAEKYPEFFDKIIVDAPCSGEGMFKKEPQAVTEWSIEHTISCGERQKNILDSAISMLKGGGKLVYSTCTFAPCENEEVVNYILQNYPEMKLLPIEVSGMSDGLTSYGDEMAKTKRIFPHKAKGEGHFVALFEKVSGGVNDCKKAYKCDMEKTYRSFEKDNLNCRLSGHFVSFGENLYLMPYSLDIEKIKVVSPGLYLGVCKKDRFEPSFALSLALSGEDFKRTIDISDYQKYFHGETMSCTEKGWTGVFFDGYPIGWGKASGGVLKNHFPKHLRY